VTVVVQQRGSDDDWRLARLLSEGCTLQSVLKLRHVLAIMTMTVLTIGSQQVVEVVWIHDKEC